MEVTAFLLTRAPLRSRMRAHTRTAPDSNPALRQWSRFLTPHLDCQRCGGGTVRGGRRRAAERLWAVRSADLSVKRRTR
jgi:hypothetical protein